jgi:threonine dehydrogenase-like Zn-dependent dehydrogenase
VTPELYPTPVLVLRAEDAPMAGVPDPGPHQRYRRPTLTIEHRAPGALPPDHVRVRMRYAGVCGTDLHLVEADPATGYVRSSAPAVIPPRGRAIGHEGVGEVLAAGAAVHHLRPGAVVTFASILFCGRCEPCRRGAFNQCDRSELVGMQRDGLFGTVVDLPAVLAHDVSALAVDDASLRALACVEPAAVALLACERAAIRPGDQVAIFGAGPIGLYAAMLCRVMGASRVRVVEPVARRRDLAAGWCDAALEPEAFLDSREPVDVALEASGDLANVTRIVRRMRAGGRIVLLARSGQQLVIDAVDHLITQAVTVAGVRGHLGGPIARVLSLLGAGRLPLGAAVTGVLEGLEPLLELLRTPARVLREHCKVLVKLG